MKKNLRQPLLFCTVLLIAIIFLPTGATGQSNIVNVQGKMSDRNGTPISYATVTIKDGNGTVVQTKFADEPGNFFFQNIPQGFYTLSIDVVGYITKLQDISVSENTDLGVITLEQDPNVLAEVTVTARRPVLSRQRDRLVMNVENMVSASGRSSMELLSMVPGVFVMQGNISINGVSGSRVMVDGRMLNISGDDLKDYLRNLKAEDIQSIEVIARPPAEYEASGSGGLINIVMKKRRESGLQARIGHDYSKGLGHYPSYRPFAGVSYNSGKMTLSADYSFSDNKSFENLSQSRVLSQQGQYTAANNSIDRTQSHRVRLSGIYDITKDHVLAIDYTGRFSRSVDSLVSHTTITYPEPQQNTVSSGDFPMVRPVDYHNVGVNYTWKTDTLGSTFRVVADYTNSDKRPSSGTFSETFDAQDQLLQDTSFLFRFPSMSQIVTAEARYQKKWTTSWDMQVGAKLSHTDINNQNAYDILRDGNWISDMQSFDYFYKERIAAGFVSLSGELYGTTFNVGLRGENSSIQGEVSGDGQDTIIGSDYFNLFPTLYLQRVLDQQGRHVLTFSANRRIQRPSYNELNPYRYFLDNYSVVTGNPHLRPQITHGGELAYLFRQKYYLAFSYNKTKDVIYQIIETDPESDMLLAWRKNTGKQEVYTVTISAPIQFVKWWSSSNNLLLSSGSSVAPEFDLQLNTFVFQSEHEFTLPKGWTASLSAMYTPRILQGNVITRPISNVDLGVRKRFFNDRLTAAASISDIFYTANFDAKSYYNNDVILIGNRQQTRVLSLSLTYNINIGKSFKMRSLMKSNTEESGRL
ncbi:outer membrane receptor protein involved in Fe transport [Sphingobacterium allocomposti]|uniref:Outer membrane receptor protein involved in Fe transport n=1 Tax=Sphingobacterium allocomposti TaxID=415956 RepID=A0A5S5D8X9_9SPHI|nr:outer membrane beta-barrel family protein [Sphingobacterium composti Yoo et al. 2007 non Ten et al. 2007]TYP91788.1 outer membrane receptor protein involved in Fe transport [Sphingobacterium composti Yoo et al. 2007 non Ten et al. 2007]